MVYLIIIVAVLVIVAPILAVLPTKRDKARMVKRRHAMGVGVGVEMTSIEDPDTDIRKYRSSTGKPLPRKRSVAAYRLRRKQASNLAALGIPDWTVVRYAARDRKPLFGPWHWEKGDSESQPAMISDFLTHELDRLPTDVIKIEEKNMFISLYWQEDGEVSEVIDFLERCAAL